jgi:hypothetical protein
MTECLTKEGIIADAQRSALSTQYPVLDVSKRYDMPSLFLNIIVTGYIVY